MSELENDKEQASTPNPSLAVLKSLFTNFPEHVRHLDQVPCASRSLYTGLLAGGIVAGSSILLTKSLRSARYGFFAFIGTSVVSWEWYRYRLRSRLESQQSIPPPPSSAQ